MLLCEQRERRMEQGVKKILRIKLVDWINLERRDKDVLIRLNEISNGTEEYSTQDCEIKNNTVVGLILQICNLRGKFENETTTTIFTL